MVPRVPLVRLKLQMALPQLTTVVTIVMQARGLRVLETVLPTLSVATKLPRCVVCLSSAPLLLQVIIIQIPCAKIVLLTRLLLQVLETAPQTLCAANKLQLPPAMPVPPMLPRVLFKLPVLLQERAMLAQPDPLPPMMRLTVSLALPSNGPLGV